MLRVALKLLFAVTALAVLAIGMLYVMLGTQSGTRWLLAQAGGYVPGELQIDNVEGALIHGFTIDSLNWRGDAAEVAIAELAVDIGWWPLFGGTVAVQELDVASVDIEIFETEDEQPADPSGLPEVDLPIEVSLFGSSVRNLTLRSSQSEVGIDEIRLAANMNGPDLSVADLRVRAPQLDLALSGAVRLSDRYPAHLESVWAWRIPEGRELSGELTLAGDLRSYELEHVLTSPVTVTTGGTIAYVDSELSANLVNEWQALELALGENVLRSSSGVLRVDGPVPGFELDLDTFVTLDELPETRVQLAGRADATTLNVARLELRNAVAGVLASGTVDWLPQPRGSMTFSVVDADPSFAIDALAGAIELDGRLDGRIVDEDPSFELTISRIGGSLNDRPVAGDAAAAFADGQLSLTSATLQVGSNRLAVTATVGDSVALDANIELAALSELLPAGSGSLTARMTAEGPRDTPVIDLQATGSDLSYETFRAASLMSSIIASPSDQSEATVALDGVTVGETSLGALRLALSGTQEAHRFDASATADGAIAELAAQGGYQNGEWSGRLHSLAADAPEIGRWATAQASELTFSPARVSIEEICLHGARDGGNACVELDYQPEDAAAGMAVDVSLNGVPLSPASILLPSGMAVSGRIDGHFEGRRDAGLFSGDAEISLTGAAIHTDYEGEMLTAALSLATGTAQVIENRLEANARIELEGGAGGGGIALSMDDVSDRESAIDGQSDITISDLGFLTALSPQISDPAGRIEGSLGIGGSLNEPAFSGAIALTDGGFGVRSAGIAIEALQVRLEQQSSGRLRLTGSAQSGEGHVSVSGETRVGASAGVRTEILISGDNFELARLPEWQIAASPSIAVVFDDRVTSVTGALVIPSANIRVKSLPATAETVSPDTTVHRADANAPPVERRIEVDVAAALGDDVSFAGFGLTTGIEGALRVRGGTHSPYTGSGKLALRGGRYKAYGQDLEIERGELLFRGPLDDPDLNIRAVRRADDVVAGIQLSGRPSRLRSDVFSDPALSDAEALSYLLTGRPLSSAGSGEGDALSDAAFALGLSGAGAIGSRIRGQLGLDTLTVEGGAESGRIVAGRRFGDRLLVEYGYGLIDKLGTLLIRYQLNERLMLESQTGSVSNLDIVYSVKKD